MKFIEEVSWQKIYMKIKKSKRNLIYKDKFFYCIYRKFMTETSSVTRLTDWSVTSEKNRTKKRITKAPGIT